MAENIPSDAAAYRFAIDQHAATECGKIRFAPVLALGAEHDAAIPGIIGDQVESIGLFVVGVLVVDDLNGRHAGTDCIGHGIAVVASSARKISGPVAAET